MPKRSAEPKSGSAKIIEKLKEERTKEVEELSTARAGAVSELKSRFMASAGPKAGVSVRFSNPVEQSAPPAPNTDKDTIDTVITIGEVQLEQRQEAAPIATEGIERTDTSGNVSGFHTPGMVEEPESTQATGRDAPNA